MVEFHLLPWGGNWRTMVGAERHTAVIGVDVGELVLPAERPVRGNEYRGGPARFAGVGGPAALVPGNRGRLRFRNHGDAGAAAERVRRGAGPNDRGRGLSLLFSRDPKGSA